MRSLRNSRNFALALLRSPVKERGLAEGRKCASTEQKGVARANLKVFTWQTGKASDVTCSQSVTVDRQSSVLPSFHGDSL